MPSLIESIGRVLGDRYRLVSALGTGASAQVFLADDVSLHRRVAIKLLHPALADDASFLKRFRAEARVVAALNHPNVLQVYDWGEDDGTPFLVLEYLAGGSLRQAYDTGTLLTPEQAVRVGIEATAGLTYAHRRGLVHRDIKPANLLFDADERLRIADFGLARALAEAAWTEPEGAVLGTARYAAPEQVEGLTLDGKADVYALAIVLYEGVTGQAPFSADTTLATLMARVGTLLPEHEALGPLNEVLEWAAAPDPAERYDSAAFGARLRALATTLPEPRPLLPGGVDHHGEPAGDGGDADRSDGLTIPFGFVAGARSASARSDSPAGIVTGIDATVLDARTAGIDPTLLGGPIADPTLLGSPVASADPTLLGTPLTAAEGVAVGATAGGAAVDAGAVATVGVPAVASAPPLHGRTPPERPVAPPPNAVAKERTGRRKWPLVVLIVALVVALLGAGGYAAVKTQLFVPSHPVPSLVGRSLPDAARLTNPDHFNLHQTGSAYSLTVAAGLIISQRPAPRHGTRVVTAKQGTGIAVVVSKGLPPVTIPAVTSFQSCSQAIQALLAVHLVGVCPASAAQYSSTVGVGGILGSSPAATALYGSTVTIITSKGHAPVAIPVVNGTGSNYAAAAASLKAAGLNPVERRLYSSSVPSTEVIGTVPDPSVGPVPYGSTVTVDVSKGPQPVTIPDVLYSGVASAIKSLEALGLKVTTYGPTGSGIVVFCDPSAGTQVLPGTTVVLDTI